MLHILKKVYKRLDLYMDEIHNHQNISLIHIKSSINNRNQLIMHEMEQSLKHPKPKEFKDKVIIEEHVHNPSHINLDLLPNEVFMDITDNLFSHNLNPYVEAYIEKHPNYHQNINSSPQEGPTIVIPDKK